MFKRISALLLVLAAIAAAFWLPDQQIFSLTVGSQPQSLVQQVKAKDLTLVCPGAFEQSASSGKVGSFTRLGAAAIDFASNLPAGASLRQLALTGAGATSAALPSGGGALANMSASAAVAITVADPNGVAAQNSTLLSAQNYQVASAAGVNGALGANCQRPASQQWFVGASTATGREALIILANPNSTDATVNLRLFGLNGAIDGAGLNAIAVAANRTVVLPLAGFAPDNALMALSVSAQGASIAAWVQQKTVRGTLAGGADLISPALEPAKQLVIPGLLKRGTSDAAALIAKNADYADLTPSVGVFVPGAGDANVTVQVIGTDAKTFGTVVQQTVSGGAAVSIPVTGLKDGNYSVFVSADQPVIAAVQLSRTLTAHATAGQNSTTDFVWLNAILPETSKRNMPVPNSGVSKLSVATTSAGPAILTITGSGAKQTISIAKQTSKVVSLTAGSVVSVSSDSPVSATMIVDFNSRIVAIPAVNFGNQGRTISVSVR